LFLKSGRQTEGPDILIDNLLMGFLKSTILPVRASDMRQMAYKRPVNHEFRNLKHNIGDR